MKTLTALAMGFAVVLTLHAGVWAQFQEGPSPYRIALKDENVLMEPDPEMPGRHTLFWEGTIIIDARTKEPIKLIGEAFLSPMGQWTPAQTSRFGTSSLVPGINTVYRKFALGSIDLPDRPGQKQRTTMEDLFDFEQVVKVKLSLMRQGYWAGAPALAEVKYDLKPLGYALLSAATVGDAGQVRALLDKGADPDSADVQKWTALMAASAGGHRAVVKMLLDRGAKVNERRRGFPYVTTELGSRYPFGHTALMGACSFGDPETVRLLLAAGAGVNFERSDRWTALMAAAYGGHSHIVSMLLNKGASANVVTEWGYSPSALAAINGNAGIVRMLRARGDVIRVPWDDLTRQ